MDYIAVNSPLFFDACQSQVCVNVTIIDDIIKEENEFFNYSLSMASPDSKFNFDPANGVIFIMDNEGMLLHPSLVKNCTLR